MADLYPITPLCDGKYSKRLNRLIAREQKMGLRIYSGTWNSVTGHDPDNPVLYIGRRESGDSEWIHAAKLMAVRCGNNQFMAYGPAHGAGAWKDVTDDLWPVYERIGVCAFDSNSHKWTESGGDRVCDHCGQRQVLQKVVRITDCWTDVIDVSVA